MEFTHGFGKGWFFKSLLLGLLQKLLLLLVSPLVLKLDTNMLLRRKDHPLVPLLVLGLVLLTKLGLLRHCLSSWTSHVWGIQTDFYNSGSVSALHSTLSFQSSMFASMSSRYLFQYNLDDHNISYGIGHLSVISSY